MTNILTRLLPNAKEGEINIEQFESLLKMTGERPATIIRKALFRHYKQIPQELIDAAEDEIQRIKKEAGKV